jgi:hypothetical protein
MLFHRWGGKTIYYSFVNKRGAKKVFEDPKPTTPAYLDIDVSDCESCKL